jgi:ubiquinone/menaquinone biosynthesis C-methylase UbiE
VSDPQAVDQAERYDRMAAGYERWWAPVLAPSAVALLDRLDSVVAPGDHVIDVGAGTGNLTRAALVRWADARVTAIDASSEMLVALDAAVAARPATEAERYASRTADAGELPFDDATFDVAMSSFVLQLVSSRAKALREIRRVLRPGGTLSYVTWLRREAPFAPDRIFDALLAEAGYDEEPPDGRCGDVPSPSTGAAEMRSAGFRDVAAEEGALAYAFSVDSYIGFLTEFDEESLFEDMGRTERRRFVATLRERLMGLDPDELVFRAPIVYVSGRRSR